MNNSRNIENLAFEIDTLEDILRELILLEENKGFIALKAALNENLEFARKEIEDRSKSDSELRHLSGYLTGLRFYDTFKETITYDIDAKRANIKLLTEGVEI